LWGLLLFLLEQEMTQFVMTKSADGLVCVMLEVHIWGGRRHLERDDLLAANPALSKLPTKTLASLGAYKICNPDLITEFQKVKGKAERYLRRAGLPILGASGIPQKRFEADHAKLLEFQAEFQALEDTFLKGYDDAVAKWAADQMLENPDYAHLLNNPPSKETVSKKLGFAFHCYRINAPALEDNVELNRNYVAQVGGLKGQLLKEVAAEADLLVQQYLVKEKNGVVSPREYVTPRTLGPLRRAAAKLDDFRFLDPTIGPLAEMVNDVVSASGAERIDGAALVKVWSLSRLLGDPVHAVKVAEAAAQGANTDDLLAAMAISNETKPAVQSAAAAKAPDISLETLPAEAVTEELSLLL
jgi:uncharacterized protein DUF3150